MSALVSSESVVYDICSYIEKLTDRIEMDITQAI